MDSGVQQQWLEDGKRLHLQHGPIDLIVEANGEASQVATAYQQACDSFQSVLTDLVTEIDELRTPLQGDSGDRRGLVSHAMPKGAVAERMVAAAQPYAKHTRVTPMIAVAGSVADHILQHMLSGTQLTRAYVNNGGDIALWLAQEQRFTIGICDNTATGNIDSHITIQAQHEVRGIATSGWRGRSHSLGIADAVTVLATCAANADAAATLIANDVDVPGATNIQRTPACELLPDSDLGDTPVTVAVGALDCTQINTALNRGTLRAEQLLVMGRIKAAYICLAGQTVVLGAPVCTLRAGVMHA